MLRLSTSSEPHEAARATERARELMNKFGITPIQVEEHALVVVEELCDDPYRMEIAVAVSQVHGCAAIISKRGGIAFRGPGSVVQSAGEVYHSMVREAEQGWDTAIVKGSPANVREAWKNCFWLGFVTTVVQRVYEMKPVAVVKDPEPAEQVREAFEHATSNAQEAEPEDEAIPPWRRPQAQQKVREVPNSLEKAQVALAGGRSIVDIRWLQQQAHSAGVLAGMRVGIDEPSHVQTNVNRQLTQVNGEK